jgi:perosamine synthetase
MLKRGYLPGITSSEAEPGMSSPIRIPIYQPELGEKEKAYVNQCLDSTWISSKGEFIERFQAGFARYIGAQQALAVSNGTVALHLALAALGLGPGDEVIVPSLTYVAPVNAIRYVGATPVFAEADATTWQVSPTDVAARITPRTKAIIAVHLYGQACDMAALADLARSRGLLLVEDCAEALGTRIGSQHVGTFGDIATFSFFGNKTITTGEGGMVVAREQTLHRLALKLRGQGLADDREYWHDVVGFNFRMTNICAAIGLAQLERADEFLARKRVLAEAYARNLAGLPLTMHAEVAGTTHSFWMCSLLTSDPAQRDPLRRTMREAGIETRPLFHPVHTMPMYAQGQTGLDVSVALAARGINLPSWPGLGEEGARIVSDVIRGHFRR